MPRERSGLLALRRALAADPQAQYGSLVPLARGGARGEDWALPSTGPGAHPYAQRTGTPQTDARVALPSFARESLLGATELMQGAAGEIPAGQPLSPQATLGLLDITGGGLLSRGGRTAGRSAASLADERVPTMARSSDEPPPIDPSLEMVPDWLDPKSEGYRFRETTIKPGVDTLIFENPSFRKEHVGPPAPRDVRSDDTPMPVPLWTDDEQRMVLGMYEGRHMDEDLMAQFQDEVMTDELLKDNRKLRDTMQSFWNAKELPEEIGPNGLTIEQLGAITGRLAKGSGILEELQGRPFTRGQARPNAMSGEDIFGPYRRPEAMSIVMRAQLPEDEFRRVLAHELGHAVMGIRDNDMMQRWLRNVAENQGMVSGQRDWDMLQAEMVENSMQNARPRSWKNALGEANFEELSMRPATAAKFARLVSKTGERGAQQNEEFDRLFKKNPKHGAYLMNEAELSADAIGTMITQPSRAVETMPRTTELIKQIMQTDPQTKGKFKWAAAPVALAAESLRRYEQEQEARRPGA